MRFMMFIKHPGDYDPGEVPQALFGAMGEFVGENAKKGVFIDGAGLQPLAKATRVRLAGGKIKVTDGPFSEAKEVVGGYALCECEAHEFGLLMITPRGSRDFELTLVALACLFGTKPIDWIVTHPANRERVAEERLGRGGVEFFAAGAGHASASWTTLRNRAEGSHVARAVLGFAAILSLLLASQVAP